MFISNTYSVVNAAYVSKANSTNISESVQTTQSNDGRDDVDNVILSTAGRQAAYAENLMPGAQKDTSESHPLEMYQMPGWQAEYMFQVPGQLGTEANWFAKNYPQAASTSMSERVEYAELIQGHYQAVLDANSIRGTEAHYKATILDQDFSESLRQQMSESVKSDTRLVELMTKMGKSIS